MPATPKDNDTLMRRLLQENDVLDAADKLGDAMYQLRWGSATVISGVAGSSIVVIAPMFPALPERDPAAFTSRLLELNAQMGGTAAFAVQPDGAVVLQVGRSTEGLDASEFAIMLGTVGKFADDFDNALHAEFYA